jgi:hypothetical protein
MCNKSEFHSWHNNSCWAPAELLDRMVGLAFARSAVRCRSRSRRGWLPAPRPTPPRLRSQLLCLSSYLARGQRTTTCCRATRLAATARGRERGQLSRGETDLAVRVLCAVRPSPPPPRDRCAGAAALSAKPDPAKLSPGQGLGGGSSRATSIAPGDERNLPALRTLQGAPLTHGRSLGRSSSQPAQGVGKPRMPRQP